MHQLKRFWNFLKQDTWQSWLTSLILIIIIIKFIFFPLLSLITGTSLPLVVVESCSMYHSSSFDSWWPSNSAKYTNHNISTEEFSSFPLKNGLNKGDIVIVWGHSSYEKGDIIIFAAPTENPIIHRLMRISPYATIGDNNPSQLPFEYGISEEQVLGKAVARIPLVGWVKLAFFELSRKPENRGLC